MDGQGKKLTPCRAFNQLIHQYQRNKKAEKKEKEASDHDSEWHGFGHGNRDNFCRFQIGAFGWNDPSRGSN